MKTLIYGYCTKNFGDDLLIHNYCVNNTKDDLYLFDVLPEFNSEVFSNIRLQVKTKTIFKRIIPKFGYVDAIYLKLMAKSFEKLVIIGGSMFIEKTENKRLYTLIQTFVKQGKPVEILGANFGPYTSKYFYEKYEKLFESNFVTVVFRDKKSYGLFNANDKKSNILLGTDLALFKSEKFGLVEKTHDSLAIVPINVDDRFGLSSYSDFYVNYIMQVVKDINPQSINIYGFCRFENDEEFINKLSNLLPNAKCFIYDGDLEKFMIALNSNETIVSSRFHGVVCGVISDANVLSLSYNDKNESFLTSIKSEIDDVPISSLSGDIQLKNGFSPKKSNHNVDDLNSYLNSFESFLG